MYVYMYVVPNSNNFVEKNKFLAFFGVTDNHSKYRKLSIFKRFPEIYRAQ